MKMARPQIGPIFLESPDGVEPRFPLPPNPGAAVKFIPLICFGAVMIACVVWLNRWNRERLQELTRAERERVEKEGDEEMRIW
jgi:hypothetical protein